MVRTLETYKEDLFIQIENLKDQILDLDQLKRDNQIDITQYVRNTFSPATAADIPLRHVVFVWCFDNDIQYKILNKELFNDNPMALEPIIFIFMEFKNQPDMIAFKLRWMNSNNNSWNEEVEIDDEDIPF